MVARQAVEKKTAPFALHRVQGARVVALLPVQTRELVEGLASRAEERISQFAVGNVFAALLEQRQSRLQIECSTVDVSEFSKCAASLQKHMRNGQARTAMS